MCFHICLNYIRVISTPKKYLKIHEKSCHNVFDSVFKNKQRCDAILEVNFIIDYFFKSLFPRIIIYFIPYGAHMGFKVQTHHGSHLGHATSIPYCFHI